MYTNQFLFSYMCESNNDTALIFKRLWNSVFWFGADFSTIRLEEEGFALMSRHRACFCIAWHANLTQSWLPYYCSQQLRRTLLPSISALVGYLPPCIPIYILWAAIFLSTFEIGLKPNNTSLHRLIQLTMIFHENIIYFPLKCQLFITYFKTTLYRYKHGSY